MLLINSLSLGVMLLLILVSVHWLAATYFMTLMERYGVSSDDAHQVFLKAVDRYLIVSSLAGFAIASMMSLWLCYRLLSPISQITNAATRIADGDFCQQITVRGCGEIDQLSRAFNSMAERLQQTDRLRKDFIVDVAHELRTPLTNIRGYLEGLRDEVIQPIPNVFESLHEETLRLVRLVEELLQLARADRATADIVLQPVDLMDLLEQVLDRFSPRFSAKHLSARLSGTSPIWVDGDRERITQIVTNLLENALRYSPPEHNVDLLITANSGFAHCSIINDIEGPPPDTDSLFERFQRGEASRSRQYGGAGLGLAIVKELVLAHAGHVGCRFLNGRAEFWFELPLAQPSADPLT
jgi:signal transduction histidine kinase